MESNVHSAAAQNEGPAEHEASVACIQIGPQVRVKHRESERYGTLCPTIYLLLPDGDDELSVVYDDGDGPTTLNCEGGREAFDLIGPECAQPDPVKCGAGLGAQCCIFLTCGPKGFECERYGPLRYSLQFKTMVAKRDPVEPYPKCMLASGAA